MNNDDERVRKRRREELETIDEEEEVKEDARRPRIETSAIANILRERGSTWDPISHAALMASGIGLAPVAINQGSLAQLQLFPQGLPPAASIQAGTCSLIHEEFSDSCRNMRISLTRNLGTVFLP